MNAEMPLPIKHFINALAAKVECPTDVFLLGQSVKLLGYTIPQDATVSDVAEFILSFWPDKPTPTKV